jgi:hypothetical protein
MRILLFLAVLLSLSGSVSAATPGLDAATRFVVAAHDELPAPIWKRVLEVRDSSGNTIRHYLVFNIHHTFFCYSAQDGSRRIWPMNTSPVGLARAISPSAQLTALFVQPASLRSGE